MPQFKEDLARGQNLEDLVKNALGEVSEIPKHDGDMQYKGIAIEVKGDFKAVQTGNACLELCDYYSRQPGIIMPTGVCKHSLQPHSVLMVHQYSASNDFMLYEPVTALRWLWKAVHTSSVRIPRPWNNNGNGSGKTMGALVSLKTFQAQDFVKHANLDTLKQRVDEWGELESSRADFEHVQTFLRTAIAKSPEHTRPIINGFQLKGH